MDNQSIITISCHYLLERRNVYVSAGALPSDGYISNRIFAATVCGFLIIPTVFLNAVVIVTIQKSSQLKNKIYFFPIVLQSIADVGVGCFSVPVVIFYLITPFVSVDQCIALHLNIQVRNLPTGISIVTLSAMTMERYFGVVHPYFYETQVTKRRIIVYVTVGASAVLLVSILSILLPIRGIIAAFLTAIIILCLIFNAFVYARIYLVIRRLVLRAKDMTVDENRNRKKHFLREKKHARSCVLVVVCFLFCFAPYLLSLIFFLVYGRLVRESFLGWSLVLVVLNPSLNSVIFFWTKTLLRREAIKIARAIWVQWTDFPCSICLRQWIGYISNKFGNDIDEIIT